VSSPKGRRHMLSFRPRQGAGEKRVPTTPPTTRGEHPPKATPSERMRRRKQRPQVSIVIPCYNEELNIPTLLGRLFKALDQMGRSYEVLFVDDGSKDKTLALLIEAAQTRPTVRVIELARNCGQHAAIFAALAASRGEVVVTLDADLQNPPEEIPKLLAKIDEGYDVVGGWRSKRDDPAFRKFASKIVNGMVRRSTGVMLHDYGCMLRAYRRPVAKRMANASEVTSFIPALANQLAGKVTEVEVEHAARAAGESKYSLWKLMKLQFDLMTGFSTVFLQSISGLGMLVAFGAMIFGVYLGIRRLAFFVNLNWVSEQDLKEEHGIFTLFAMLFFVIGAQFVAIGVLGEYVGRIYTEVRRRPRYLVRKVWRGQPALQGAQAKPAQQKTET
jgi:undecaprenyl-phosphate 4-deoxy-4-formamido-L-arabinose transferase